MRALRTLFRTPGFTLVAVLTLALGIGATTTIFSVVNGIMLQPLPYPQPDRLMNIWEASQKQNFPKAPLPPANVYDLIAQNQTFSAMAAWGPASLNLSGEGIEPERLDGASVTADFSTVLRTPPVRGRFFNPSEFTSGQDTAVLLSYALWQQRFAGDAGIVGQTIQLNGRARTVVGVMPDGFAYPGKTVAWVPYAPDDAMKQRRDIHNLRLIGRLKDGVSPEQARADLVQINRRLAAEFPTTNADWSVITYPMLEDAVSAIRQPLNVLLAAVGALLLIACANVANLLLVRAAARGQEIAVRASLGASRWRLVRQLLGENLTLFALGAGAGTLLAQWGLRGLLAIAPSGIPRLNQVEVDARALGFTLGVTLLTGLVFGLVPAWQGSRANLNQALRAGGRGATVHRSLLRSALVVLQVSAAVMLLIVAGLLVRSFDQVRRVNLGFDPDQVLTFRLDLPAATYNNPTKNAQFIGEAMREFGALPGVRSAGATTSVPLAGGPTYIMRFEGRPPVTPSNAPVARHRVVTSDYFSTLGMTLVRGRAFTAIDAPGSPLVCVINQTLAQKYFPNEDPIGKRLEIGFSEPPNWREIVGIVADVETDGLDAATPVQVFEPVHQWHINSYSIALHMTGDSGALVASLRATLKRLDPTLPVHTVKPMTQLVSESLAQRTFSLVLLIVFAVVALLLAAIGIYGVVAYSVTQRTREFGVRIALGARTGNVLGLVLRQGVVLTGLGIALGIAGAFALSRFVQAMLFGVDSHDPLTFTLIPLGLALVALLACLLPALRATKVDPMTALRAE